MAKHYIELSDGLVIVTDDPSLWREGKRLSAAEGKRKRAEYAKAQLLKILQPGMTVYTVLRHVSASGMARRIDLYAIVDNEPRYLSGYAADVCGMTIARDKPGIQISGCGMDMGFELVYRLGSALWPNGTAKPHGTRNGQPDTAGGYALSHRWM